MPRSIVMACAEAVLRGRMERKRPASCSFSKQLLLKVCRSNRLIGKRQQVVEMQVVRRVQSSDMQLIQHRSGVSGDVSPLPGGIQGAKTEEAVDGYHPWSDQLFAAVVPTGLFGTFP
eukprot:3165384-Amphidinium_carterae.2